VAEKEPKATLLVVDDGSRDGTPDVVAAIAAEELGRADISLAVPVLYLVEAAWGYVLDRYGGKSRAVAARFRKDPLDQRGRHERAMVEIRRGPHASS